MRFLREIPIVIGSKVFIIDYTDKTKNSQSFGRNGAQIGTDLN